MHYEIKFKVNDAPQKMRKIPLKVYNCEDLLPQAPPDTGHLRKTPLSRVIQSYLDYLCDTIFDTDDDYMNNQRWKK